MELILNGPLVSLILGLVAILAFRGPLARLIDRTTKVTKEGATFDRPQEASEIQAKPLSFDELMKQPISASALNREQVIKQALENFALKTDQERISVLTRSLAINRTDSEFANIAHTIFGSQLGLLVKLASGRSGVSKAEADHLFIQAQESFPDLHGSRTTDEWLKYLVISELISIQGETIDITQYGSDFLKFLVDARLAYDRYG